MATRPHSPRGCSGMWVCRWRALCAWLGLRRLRSRRACVSVVVPRAAAHPGLGLLCVRPFQGTRGAGEVPVCE
eukprot:1494775-Prymnesium_polylepis.2